jgi:hypothetical protein
MNTEMNQTAAAIEIKGPSYASCRAEAMHDFNLRVPAGRCYGLFGRSRRGNDTRESGPVFRGRRA